MYHQVVSIQTAMPSSKDRYKKGLPNDLSSNEPESKASEGMDPEIEHVFDSYDANPSQNKEDLWDESIWQSPPEAPKEKETVEYYDAGMGTTLRMKKGDSTRKRDGIVVAVVLAMLLLWSFDWSPRNAADWASSRLGAFFGNSDQVEQVVQGAGSGSAVTVDGETYSFVQYLAAVQQMDFNDTPSTSQIQAMYSTGVSMEYLRGLESMGYLDEISYSGIIGLYSSGVSIEYLQGLSELNYLDEVSYSGVIGLYSNGVPISYLSELNRLNYLDEVSYSGIIGLYTSGVSTDYLVGLNRLNYLDEISYSGIIGMYTSGVPVDYLQTLNQVDYLDEISYSGIIALYSNGVSQDLLLELYREDLLDNLSYTDIIMINQQR